MSNLAHEPDTWSIKRMDKEFKIDNEKKKLACVISFEKSEDSIGLY